jgi:hypothetical protein
MQITDLRRVFAYHSPQWPGFTSWCFLSALADDSILVSFTQATGPLTGRPTVPPQVRARLNWPPPEHGGQYDMTGLDLRNVYLRSSDGGASFERVSADSFTSCMNGAVGAETALPDGTLLRAVWGHYLPYDDLPATGLMQRSADGARNWSSYNVIYPDQAYTFWPRRMRVLRDGRLALGGGLSPYLPTREAMALHIAPVMLVSADNGETWEGPFEVITPEQRGEMSGEEFDFAELDNGDLLVVLRVAMADPDTPGRRREYRKQTRLVKHDSGWAPGEVTPAPFPHSGHPELLRTREGAVLHLATSGISWTSDEGRTWTDLAMPDDLNVLGWKLPGTHYYPRAVQLSDGLIFCVGHVGSDDPYGCVDQSILGMSFRLSV